MTNSANRPMQWSSQKPSTLWLPSVRNGRFTIDHMLADPGVGCNEHELSALIKIITAHETYMQTKRQDDPLGNDQQGKLTMYRLKELSTIYRSAVRDCLSEWELSIEERLLDSNIAHTIEQSEEDNVELLKIVHSIMHASDIFLPLLPSSYNLDYPIEPYQRPGIVTAAMVRYLRYHHLLPAEDSIPGLSADDVVEMMNSAQPEEFHDGKPFWDYVRQLVLRGCLEQAWIVLSKHSLFSVASALNRHSSYDNDSEVNNMTQMSEVVQGFLHLKEVMLRAPLPGGRNEIFDDSLDLDDGFVENIEEAILFIDGLDVVPGDYRVWETEYSTTFANANSDYPDFFSETLATQKHRQWSDYVQSIRPYFTLKKRIRELDSILSILSGDFNGIHFSNWALRICAELLYRCPDSRPIQICKRARRVIEHYGSQVENSPHIDAVLSVMEGDASTAIEVIHSFGGSTGAALPATLMSLLYNLFIEASIIPEDLAFRKTEFLDLSSSAIISSLADSNQDIGVQLSTRLLIPHAMERKNIEIVATLESLLSRYHPSSDTFAETLLSQVSPMLDMKSLSIMDSCVSVLLCRYRFHKSKNRMEQAIRILMKGIGVESKVLDDINLGLCYKVLVSDCQQSSLFLLNCLARFCQFDPDMAITAKDIAKGLTHDNNDYIKIPEASMLLCVLSILDNYGKNDEQRRVGNNIIDCLSGKYDKNGVMKKQVPLSILRPCLRLAGTLIDECKIAQVSEHKNSGLSPFDRNGIAVLMESFQRFRSTELITTPDMNETQKNLVFGLSQAIRSDNSGRTHSDARKKRAVILTDGILSSKLNGYGVNIQEEVVKRMLES